jgi:hypothetical protein
MAGSFKIARRVSAKMEPFNAKHEISRLKPLTCVVCIDFVFEKTTEGDVALHVAEVKGSLIEVNIHRVHFMLKSDVKAPSEYI